LVQEVAHLLESDGRRQAISLRLELDESLGYLKVDRLQIQQVLVNLVRNAFDAVAASNQGARVVTVGTRRAGGGALLQVRDTGIGLPEGHEDEMFEAFFTTKAGGLGIGLAISRSIVTAHGGRLWAERNPDRGASFLVSLPAS
jgi:signal transduction histidine kinase